VSAIPLGIVWYFILKYKVADDNPVSEFVMPVKEAFKPAYLRWMGLIVLVMCGVLIFYRLGFYDLWEDENAVMNAAIGIQWNGLSYLKEGYDRVWLHSWLISGFFDLFGVSEFTGRVPSALFGLLFVLICYYVFTRWYGIALVAILVPVVCMMNDRFLILFRYMRMYALLIPIFLAGVYILYRTLTTKNHDVYFRGKKLTWLPSKWIYLAGSVIVLLLMAHLHKLSMIVLPVFLIFIMVLVWFRKTKELKYFLLACLALGLILAYLTFGLELYSLRMFRQVTSLILTQHSFYPEYYRYVLENGLPINSTAMTLIAGMGLINPRISTPVKSILVISYLLISMALVSMIYLIASEGQDYRYIAHLVPFIVALLLYVWYQTGSMVSKKIVPWLMFLFLIISSLHLREDYKRVYVKHPWAPSYSIVYKTLVDNYRQGDALFAQNVKTYYLDPVKLAGNLYHNVPKKKEYTLEQFKHDVSLAQRGWVMWETHKVYHWRDEVIVYIYEHFKVYHGRQKDNLGLELWYFNETMIKD
jgi:4-amino-4-deoxy-L-arabinose transferase-like glycosyltransferase